MSALPPNLIASSLQSALQQRQIQHARTVADRRQADISVSVVKAGQQHESQVDDADADSQIHQDGSGSSAGGQGRAFDEEPQPGMQNASSQPDARDSDDQSPHLDITA